MTRNEIALGCMGVAQAELGSGDLNDPREARGIVERAFELADAFIEYTEGKRDYVIDVAVMARPHT